MSGDVSVTWDAETSLGTFEIVNGDLATGQDLRTAVLISLFSWRRADLEDIPEDHDPSGYWGDSFAKNRGDRLGSKLWLLLREKVNNQTIQRARDYAAQALQWLIDDGIARRIDITAERNGVDRLDMLIELYKQDSEVLRLRFDDIWGAAVNG